MQSILDHTVSVIRPALRKYLAAEAALTNAVLSGDTSSADIARQDVILAARQAADVLHHLSDFVFLKEPSPVLAFAKIEDVRSAVGAKCVFLRTVQPVGDVLLLRDVADAFKHHRPDRPSTTVLVSTDVVPVGSGWGDALGGRRSTGGVEQVVITIRGGDKRALSSVLQNVFDAWMTLLGQPLSSISTY